MKSLMLTGLIVSVNAVGAEYIAKLKPGLDALSVTKSLQAQDLNLSYGTFIKFQESQKSLKVLQADSRFEYVEPNFTYQAINQPSDEKFTKQWGLDNDGKNSGGIFFPGKKGVDISAVKAWGITKGDRALKIAVIDTGVDYSHSDLKNNMMINTLEKNGTPGVDDDGNGYVDDVYGYDFRYDDADPMDAHGHGTHCAGVIGAEHDNGGIAGVMENVQILAVQFLGGDGSGTLEGALKAIDYSTSRGVDVMSNSWGGGGFSQALAEAIERANQEGIVFVAAAGNSRSDNDAKPTYPANYEMDNVISVGALDGKGKKAGFSNYGKNSVHVFAPGVKILSTILKNSYGEMSGTSMACPHVSGVVGLLLSSEPNLTPLEVREKLMSTAVISSELDRYTASGYVDAYKALTE